MSPAKKIFSNSGEVMLSARKAAKLLKCAPDYVGKLCREGKLESKRVGNAWFISESSIVAYEAIRASARAARSETLAQERRSENEAYRKIHGLPAQPPKVVAESPVSVVPVVNSLPTRSTWKLQSAAFVFGGFLLMSAVVFAATVSAPQGNLFSQAQKNLAAALVQVDSPFFGHPVVLQSATSGSNGSIFSNLLAFFFPPKTIPLAVAPQVPTTPVVTPPPTNTLQTTPAKSIIQNITQPVIERTVVQTVSGVSQTSLDAQLSQLTTSLRQEIYTQLHTPPTPITFGGNSIPPNGNFLPLSGGTLTGGVDMTSGCFSISGVCITSGGNAAGHSGAIQFNTGGAFAATTTQFFWDVANNRLGIGTSTPQSALSLGAGGVIRITSNDGASNGCFEEVGGQLQYSNDCSSFQSFTSASAGGWTDDGTVVRLTTNADNVGVGTTSPFAKLTVWGSDNSASTLAFEVANSASTTLFSINNAGQTTLVNLLATGSTTLQNFTARNSTTTNATTTSLFASSFGLAGSYFTSLLGTGLSNSSGVLTVSTTSLGLLGSSSISGASVISYNVSSGVISTQGGTFGAGTYTFPSDVIITGNSTTTNATSTNFFATTASSTNLFASLARLGSATVSALSVGSLTGPLSALNGAVSATSTLSIVYGGTGTSTGPAYGQLLVGNSRGGYDLLATSSLGIISNSASPFGQAFEVNGGGYLAPTTTITILANNGFVSQASSTVVGNFTIAGNLTAFNATTTNATTTSLSVSGIASTTALIVSSAGGAAGCATFSSNGTISNTGTACGSGSGTFSFTPAINFGALANATNTPIWFQSGLQASSTSHFVNLDFLNATGTNATTTNLAVTGTASTTNFFVSSLGSSGTTCVQADASGKLSSTGSACGSGSGAVNSVSNSDGTLTISPTTGAVVASLNLGHANTFSALQQFGAGASTTQLSAFSAFFGATATSSFNGFGDLLVVGSTSLRNFTALNATTSQATTTSFAISSIGSGNLLKTTTGGAVVAALAGSDYATAATVNAFKDWGIVNGYLTPTTTLGIIVSASSTIGNGTAAGGLTISGFATSTGGIYVGDNANVGIGTTSPFAHLSIQHNAGTGGNISFAIGSSTSNSTTTLFSVNNTGTINLNLDSSTSTLITFAGSSFLSASSTGQFGGNIGLGLNSLNNNATTGSGNVALGPNTLNKLTTGTNNVAVGQGAAPVITTGTDNIAIGRESLLTTGAGGSNTVVGSQTGQNLGGTHSQNTALGAQALRLAIGSGNTAIGFHALSQGIGVADYNVALGYQAGSSLSNLGSYSNIFIGSSITASNLTVGSNNIGIGTSIFFASTTGSSQLNLGSLLFGSLPATSTTFAEATAGTLGVATSSPFAKFAIQANNGSTNTTLFAIGSSTQSATTTLFSISNTGSTTASNGFNITAGCFAVNGTCVPTTASLASSINAVQNWQILNGALIPTTTLGIIVSASSTIGNGTAAGGLTISGGATTTGSAYFAQKVGVGTFTPSAKFSIAANNGETNTTLFNIASSTQSATTTLFSISNTGVLNASEASGGTLQVDGTNGDALTISGLGGFLITPGVGADVTVVGGPDLSLPTGSSVAALTGSLTISGNATTTNLGISALGSGKVLKTTTGGAIIAAVAGVDYINSSFKDWNVNGTTGNFYLAPTTTLGIIVSASSTVGSGTQAGGLTISGGATTTGNAYFAGTVGINTLSPTHTLEVTGTGKFSGNLALGFGSCVGSNALQTDGSGIISCGAVTAGSGATSAGGWTTNSIGRVLLSTTTDLVAVGATSTLYAKFAVLSGSTATTTLALVPAVSQTANIIDIYNTSGNLSTVLTSGGLFGLGTTSPSATLAVQGGGLFSGNVTGANLTATGTLNVSGFSTLGLASTTGVTVSGLASSSNLVASNSFTVGNINGLLHATNGLVSAGPASLTADVTGILPIANGGTGTSTAPTYGKLLVGNAGGTYDLLATSSLGLLALSAISASSPITYNGGTGVIGFDFAANFTLTGGVVINSASTTITNLTAINATSTNATTTNLFVSGQSVVNGNFGIGSTSPFGKLSISGGNVIQTASDPTLGGSLATGNHTKAVYVSGRYAYTADTEGGLKIIDVSNPRNPSTVGSSTVITTAYSVVVAGKYAYVGDTNTGISIFDVSNPANPTRVGTFAYAGHADDVAISGKYLYATDFNGGLLRIIDVSNPTNPVQVGSYTGVTPYAVAVSGKYAYLGDYGNHTVAILDISNPTSPVLMGSTTVAASSPTDIYVSGKYAYVADAAKGLYTIDISNPANPSVIATFHASDSYYGVQVAGNYAYVADQGGANLLVVDVSASTSPRLVGTYAAGSLPFGVMLSGKYAYLADSSNGLKVVDINGADIPSANIGAIESNTVNITDSLNVGQDIFAGGGLDVGISGIFSRGTIAAYVASTTGTPVVATFIGGNVGIGTTSPFARLSIEANATGVFNTTLFAIASTTGTATTTLFSINNTGTINTNLDSSTSTLFTFAGQTFITASSTGLNTSLGSGALAKNISGSQNVAVGSLALPANTSGNQNTAIGYQALLTNSSGLRNIAVGAGALLGNTFGSDNVGIGNGALTSNNSNSNENTAVGNLSMLGLQTAQNNTALGYSSLRNNQFSSNNTAVGNTALNDNSGPNNTAVGYSTAFFNQAATNTVAVGAFAGQGTSIFSAGYDTLLGYSAGFNFTNGANYNTLLGYGAGYDLTSGANNILIGSLVDAPLNTGSNQLNIGNILYGTNLYNSTTFATSSAPVLNGSLGVGTSSPFSKFAIQANNGSTNTTLFAIGSSTSNSTTTLFSISNTGSTTAANGFNITAGCFAVNGTCAPTAATLASSIAAVSNWQILNGALTPTTTLGIIVSASSTIGNGTAAGGLTISGFATSTGGIYVGDNANVGIGTTSPFAHLAIQHNAGTGGNISFAIGSSTSNSTSTLLTIGNNGAFDLGTSSTQGFHVISNAATAGNGLSITTSGAGSGVTLGAVSAAATDNLAINGAGLNSVVSLALNSIQASAGNGNTYATVANTFSPTAESSGLAIIHFVVNTATDNGLAASTEVPSVKFKLNNTRTHNNGALVLQREFLIQGPTYAFTSFSNGTNVITDTATLGIDSAPRSGLNATTTNAYALLIGSSTPSIMFDASTTNTYGLGVFTASGARNNYAAEFIGGNVGIGTTSPFANLAIQANANDPTVNHPVFAIGSSTASATTTLFSILNTGSVHIGAPAFNDVQTPLDVVADSSGHGIHLLSTDFNNTNAGSLLDVELSQGSGNSLYSSLQTFNSGRTATGNLVLNGAGGGVGVGTTSPYAKFSIQAINGGTHTTLFAIGSSTASATTTLFIVTNTGNVGIGTTTPASLLSIAGDTYTSGFFNTSGTTGGYKIDNALVLQSSSTIRSAFAGLGAGTSTVSGLDNTALGYNALAKNISGANNTAIGSNALTNSTGSGYNVAVGARALTANTTGFQNNAIGVEALSANTTGSSNYAGGYQSLRDTTTGGNNVAIGEFSLATNITGNNNTAFGFNAGVDNKGSGNLLIGYKAGITNGATDATGLNNIALGYDAFLPNTGGNNQLNIGNLLFGILPATSTVINDSGFAVGGVATAGSLGLGTTSPFAKFSIATNNGDTATTLFAIGSSTQSATTTLFSVTNTGNVGVGTSTPYTQLALANANRALAPLAIYSIGVLPPVTRVYTADATWTKPANLDHVVVIAVGAGGAGGAGFSSTGGGGGGSSAFGSVAVADGGGGGGTWSGATGGGGGSSLSGGAGGNGGGPGNAGSGGGGGAYVEKAVWAGSLGGTVTVKVGQGGVGGGAGGTGGAGFFSGGTSSGVNGWGGGGGAGSSANGSANSGGTGGAGGTGGSIGDRVVNGLPGVVPIDNTGTNGGAAGGPIGGAGGIAGGTGQFPGGGGGGAAISGNGASGANGEVIVIEYYATSSNQFIAGISPGGYFGIGTTTPGSALSVSAGVSIGSDYSTTSPANGLIVQGKVGFGTTTPVSQFAVTTGATVGADYNVLAPKNGLLVEGPVGFGTTSPSPYNALDVAGGVSIGTFAGGAAPTNGLIVSGKTYIGTNFSGSVNTAALEVSGVIYSGAFNGNQILLNQGGSGYGVISNPQVNTWSLAQATSPSVVSTPVLSWNMSNMVGIGSTTPIAELTVATFNGATGSTRNLFLVASSTASATTTLFSIDNTGLASTTNLTVSGLGNAAGTTCVQASASGVLSSTGSACGGSGSSAVGGTGAVQFANGTSFNGDNTKLFFDGTNKFAVGSSSPFADLSIHANNLDTNTTLFAIGSSTQTSTTTLFSVSNAGQTTVGSSTRSGVLVVDSSGYTSTTTGDTLSVKGFANQTGNLLNLLNSAGTSEFNVTNAGAATLAGTFTANVLQSGAGAFSASSGTTQITSGGNLNNPTLSVTGETKTNQTAGISHTDISFNLAQTKTINNGTIALETDFAILGPTMQFTNFGSGNIVDSATTWINSGPKSGTNATTTNSYALLIGSSTPSIMFNASTTNTYGLGVFAARGALNNYAAEFLGGNVGVGTTSPFANLAIHANANDSIIDTILFAIGSSTASATTTLLSLSNNGDFTVGGTTTAAFHVINAALATNGVTITGGTDFNNGHGPTIASVGPNSDVSLNLVAKNATGLGGVAVTGASFTVNSNAFTAGSSGVGINPSGSNNQPLFGFTMPSGNPVTGGVNHKIVSFNLAANDTHANGAIALNTAFAITAENNVFNSFSNGTNVITDSATAWINSPSQTGLNGTTTNAYALLIGSSTPSIMFNASTTNTYGLSVFAAGGAVNNYAAEFLGGNVGVGTTSPFANLSIHANNLDTNTTLFAIGSSTASATTTLFSISNTGLASTTNLIVSSAGGTAGCATFSSNGTISNTGTACGSGGSVTGTTGQVAYLSGTNTAVGTSTIFIDTNQHIGFGTTSPFANLSLMSTPANFNTATLFAIGSSTSSATSTLFLVDNLGTTTTYGSLKTGTSTNMGFKFNTDPTTNGNGLQCSSTKAGSGVSCSTISDGGSESFTFNNKGNGNFIITGATTLGTNGNTFTSFGNTFSGTATNGGGSKFIVNSAADANIAASTDVPTVKFALTSIRTHVNGSLPLQREFLIQAPTYAFASFANGTNVATDTATLGIEGPPKTGTNATTTNAYAILVGTSTPSIQFNASTTNTYGLGVFASQGATNNYAAEFLGGNVGVGTTSPFAKFAIHAAAGETNRTLFAIGSSTSAATTTFLSVINTGQVFINNLTTNTAAQTSALCLSSTNEVIADTNATGCLSSSQRFKQNITTLEATSGLAEVMALNPVSFFYTAQFNGPLQNNVNFNTEQVGFIAEQVQQIDPRLITIGDDGLPSGVRYQNLTAVLAKAIQQSNQVVTVTNAPTAASSIYIDSGGNITLGASASTTLTINSGTVSFSGAATTTIVSGVGTWAIATSTATGTVPIISISAGSTTVLTVNAAILAQSIEVQTASTSQLCIGGICFDSTQAAALATVASSTLDASSTPATTTPEAILAGPFAGATDALKSALTSAFAAVSGIAQSGVRELSVTVHASVGVFDNLFAQTITVDTVYAQKLCLGQTCVTETQLQQLFSNSGASGAPSGSGQASAPAASAPPASDPGTSASSTPPDSASSPGQAPPTSPDSASSTPPTATPPAAPPPPADSGSSTPPTP